VNVVIFLNVSKNVKHLRKDLGACLFLYHISYILKVVFVFNRTEKQDLYGFDTD